MKTINKQIAVEPFKTNHTTSERNARGLDLTDLTVSSLITSKVVFNSENYEVGDILYFRSECIKLPQFRAKLKADDKEFVLVPEDLVVGVLGRARSQQ